MVTKVYSIKDDVAQQFGPLFFAINNEVAKREFQRVISTVDQNIRNDYSLWCLGSFDEETGDFDQDGVAFPSYLFCFNDLAANINKEE